MHHQNLLLKTFLFLILAELLSIFAWFFPQFNLICFGVILVLVFILALKKLQYGIYIAFAELVIGSYGYLFSFNYGNTLISIRIGIFLMIMVAWLIHLLRFSSFKKYYNELKDFAFAKYYFLLTLVLIWGFVWGIIRGNNFGNVFLDFNNWLFYLYLLPLITVSQSKRFWREFSTVILAALSWLLIKTLIFLYIFSHDFLWAWPELYTWIRDTRIGEVTQFSGNFYRVFLQSQIFALLGFFVFLPLIANIKYSLAWFKKNSLLSCLPADAGHGQGYFSILLFCLTVIIVSFSRSFWVGLIAGLIIYFLIQFYKSEFITYKLRLKEGFGQILKLILIFVVSLILIFTVVNGPPGLMGTNLASLISQRTNQIEAAGSSRINMLQPLNRAIAIHPIIGSGFGSLVTYQSLDPRILSTTAGASGEYTTYAFEWGYLDILLKIGLVGLSIYLLLIFKLLQSLWIRIKSLVMPNVNCQMSNVPLGLLLALISLLVVNTFTPYLNHPLGISFILLTTIFISNKNI